MMIDTGEELDIVYTTNGLIVFYLFIYEGFTAQVLKDFRTPGPTAC